MNALFIGDSITEGYDLEKYFPGRGFVNRGISGYSSGEVLDAMGERWFAQKPDVVFVCIGTNDLARVYDEAQTLDNISHMLDEIVQFAGEEVTIYLTSLFPTRHNPPRPNPVIDQLNEKLHALANRKKAIYLHLNPFFRDGNGQLKREFTDDGLHLNEEAYRLWTSVVGRLV